MTRFWLIRHGSHDWIGRALVGRAPGISLNAQGQWEAVRIARALAHVPLTSIYASPLERTTETAEPLAASHALEVTPRPALLEIDFGVWTAHSFDQLRIDARWHYWNAARSKASAPGGESMRQVQKRIATEVDELARRHEGEDVAVVSHGDVIKALLTWHLGMSLDEMHLLTFEPGAVALLELRPRTACLRLLRANDSLLDGEETAFGEAESASGHRLLAS